MRRSAKHTSQSAKRVSWSAKQAARSAERASQSLNPSRWNASIFTRTFDLEPVEYNHVRKLMKKVLQKDRMYGDYMNTEMAKNYPVDLTLDDLDYKKWVGYLEEDISFDPATQFLVWKKSDNAVPVYVKNERSLRVAVHCNLLDNPSQQEIVFSVIEGKDFLFLFFLNHISSHPARR